MTPVTFDNTPSARKSWLDRALSLFADVRAGEGATAVLMMANIFLLLICYSVIKTVREPLILLGGGAELRSYAAAGQALLLMGFVPLYSWFASRVDRGRLLVGVTLFFIACVELFALAVAARMPYVGVAFFVWVGIFNMSLVAQFWSFANDIYTKDAGDRLFPVIVIGMTAGAPLGSFVAARLFRIGLTPQIILQVSAALLAVSTLLYLAINRRETRRQPQEERLSTAGGFRLVLASPYLRLIAVLIVLLNVVNTTGEYLVARLLSAHVADLAHLNPAFNKQAFIGTFSGEYQFWVNVTAFLLQAFAASRLVKYRGLRGVLLALPLIALGGYAIIAVGVGFTMVRWIKTAENATDYSIMNTARQLLWLPTTREEKYKAKQAIDTFFVRGGDVVSAAFVYLGTSVLHLNVQEFAMVNIVMTLAWIGVALTILKPRVAVPRLSPRSLVAATALVALLVMPAPARAQDSREAALAAERTQKSQNLHDYVPQPLEQRLMQAENFLTNRPAFYPFIGSVYEGGGIAGGPGYRRHFGDSGFLDTHAAYSIHRYKEVDAAMRLPEMGRGRLHLDVSANWLDAPEVATYGIGNQTTVADRTTYAYRTTTAGLTGRVQATKYLSVGAGADSLSITADGPEDPSYLRSRAFAEFDWRSSPGFTHRGGLYKIGLTDYHQTNSGASSFRRVDGEVDQFIPLLRENWVIALRGTVSSTSTADGQNVPFYLMPDLGGTHALRGYPSWRFRDRNRMLMTGEYRWTAGQFVDMALFVDAGKVASRFGDLDLQDLKTSYGIGATFHTFQQTVLRVEYARTREGNALVFGVGPSF